MSDMKCPFCGKELEQYWYEDFECWYCPDIDCKGYAMTATDDTWQELIRTRKALDVAKKSLEDCNKILSADMKDWEYLTADIALKQIEQITALEQKDGK